MADTAYVAVNTKQKVKSSRKDQIFNFINYFFAVIILIIVAYPLYFVIIASFSNPYEVSAGHMWLWPAGFTLDGYKAVINDKAIWIGYRNTLIYTILGTLIGLAVNLPAAYALSRKSLVGRGLLMGFFLFTMFFSGGMIPTYFVIKQFHMLDTIWVMILPFSVSVYNIIVARTFFSSTISQELLDAAQIDGCGNIRCFLQIVIPLSKAIIAVIALWTAVGLWNSYFNALLYIQNTDLYPLQLILRNILIKNQVEASIGATGVSEVIMRLANIMKYAVIIVSTVPIMCVYPFLQKYFNQGVMIGAVKG